MHQLTKIFLVSMFFCTVLSTSNVYSAVINAASCSQPDVAAAISSAKKNDTISVPAGGCSWTSKVTLGASHTLQGAGKDVTIITVNHGGNAISVDSVEGSFFRITGFTFTGNSGISISGDGKEFRIDHNKFDGIGAAAIKVNGVIFGLIDNNIFSASSTTGGVTVFGGDQ